MVRPDFPHYDLPPANDQSRVQSSATAPLVASPVVDRVPWNSPGACEIGFNSPERYNASEILFQNLAVGRGELLAVTGPAGRRSYAQLAADAARWGNALLSLGLSRGERVLLLLDDTPVYPAAFFGAVRAGLVPILINVLTPPDQLRFYLADSGARAVVAEAEFCDHFEAACDQSSQLKTLIVVNGARNPKIVGAETKQAQSWLAAFSDCLACADTHRDDMAFWMYSSGSTGRPKGIVHLQHDMAYTHQSYGRSMLKLAPGDLCFSVPKIFLSYGFGNSITFPFSAGAASLLMPGRATPPAVFEMIEKYRPTAFFGVPTLYGQLAYAPDVEDVDFSSLKLCVSAAEFLSTEIFNAWKAATGLEIIDCLGATEVLNVYLSNTPERKKSAPRGCACPATKSSSRMTPESKSRMAAKAPCGFVGIRARRCSGTGRSEPRKSSVTAAGCAPATGSSAMRKGFISSAAARTTSSRFPASGSIRSKFNAASPSTPGCANAPCCPSNCVTSA